MTLFIPEHLLATASFFAMPDFDAAQSESDLFIRELPQAILALHRRPHDASLDPARIGTEINEVAKRVQAAYLSLKTRGGGAAAAASVPMTTKDRLAALLVCLEDKNQTSPSLMKRFHALDREMQVFLGKSVMEAHKQSDIAYGMGKIAEDPYILLRIRNDKGENLLEEVLEALHKQEAFAPLVSELQKIQAFPRSPREAFLARITTSPQFSLLCYFTWWEEGGKDNPHFGGLTYGEDRLRADPDILFRNEKGSTRVERLMDCIRSQVTLYDRSREEKEPSKVNLQQEEVLFKTLDELRVVPSSIEERVDDFIPQVRLEIFRSRFQSRGAAQSFPRNREEINSIFPITDSKELIDVVKILASISGSVSWHIESYGIAELKDISAKEKFNALVEIAKMAATRYEWGVSRFIEDYKISDIEGISDEDKFNALVEIAKIAAIQPGSSVSEFIENYKIADIKGISAGAKFNALTQIAKMAAANNPRGISLCISNYKIADIEGIPDEAKFNALVEIAKMAAVLDGMGVSANIENYTITRIEGISDEAKFNALVEIAKIAAANNGLGVSKFIAKYRIADIEGISDEAKFDALAQIAKIAIMQDIDKEADVFMYPFDIYPLLGNYGLPADHLQYLQALHVMKTGAQDDYELQEDDLESILPKPSDLETFYSKESPILKFLHDERATLIDATQEQKEHIYNLYKMHFATAQLLSISLDEPHKSDAVTKKKMEDTLLRIMNYPNPPMQAYLAFVLIKLARNPSLYKEMVSDTKLKEELSPLMVMITALASQAGKSKSNITAIYKKFSTYPIFKSSSDFANALNMLQSLHKYRTLTPEEKIKLLEQICSHEKLTHDAFNKEISQIYVLLELSIAKRGWPADLPKEFTSEKLHEAFMSCITTDLFPSAALTADEIVLIRDSYVSFKEPMRRPFAIETYGARIATLQKPDLNAAFKRFVMSLLNKTFKEERYKTEGNPHLQKLEKEYPDLWNRWKMLPPAVPIEDMVSLPASGGAAGGVARARAEEERSAFRFPFQDWLKTKLLTDKHLPDFEKTCPRLHAFLFKVEKTAEKAEKLSPAEEIENLCIDLCRGKPSTKEALIAQLSKIKELAEKTAPFNTSEWMNDIGSLIKDLSTTKQNVSALVETTDDWQHLFLSGTEVSGNCQRVDGDPSLNKCLLSECIDGKIQYVAITHPTTHKIIANAELKLLFVHKPKADGTTELSPALFMERVYPLAPKEMHVAALYQAAKARAASLGLDLYEDVKEESAAAGSFTMESLGSSAPYEYEDAGGKGITEGKYTIKGIKVI